MTKANSSSTVGLAKNVRYPLMLPPQLQELIGRVQSAAKQPGHKLCYVDGMLDYESCAFLSHVRTRVSRKQGCVRANMMRLVQ